MIIGGAHVKRVFYRSIARSNHMSHSVGSCHLVPVEVAPHGPILDAKFARNRVISMFFRLFFRA
jgi:hypothetical protein